MLNKRTIAAKPWYSKMKAGEIVSVNGSKGRIIDARNTAYIVCETELGTTFKTGRGSAIKVLTDATFGSRQLPHIAKPNKTNVVERTAEYRWKAYVAARKLLFMLGIVKSPLPHQEAKMLLNPEYRGKVRNN